MSASGLRVSETSLASLAKLQPLGRKPAKDVTSASSVALHWKQLDGFPGIDVLTNSHPGALRELAKAFRVLD
jgi:hypothetical protein